MSQLVLLDNEAIGALGDPHHPKHRRVLSHVQVVAHRRQRRARAPIRIAVPTSVRVEAGWDRAVPAATLLNRLRLADVPLDTAYADVAASVRARTGVSVADAHLGAAIRTTDATRLTVITSDPGDMRAVADDAARDVTIVAI